MSASPQFTSKSAPNTAGSALADCLDRLGLAIDDEVAALARLVALLRAEQHAFVTDAAAEIESSVAAKNAAMSAAGERRRVRIAAMDAAGIPRDPIAAELRLAAHDSLAKRWRANPVPDGSSSQCSVTKPSRLHPEPKANIQLSTFNLEHPRFCLSDILGG